MKKLFCLLFLHLSLINFAQTPPMPSCDTIYDCYGNKYKPDDLDLHKKYDAGGGNMANAYPTTGTCTAGFFEIYCEVGSGMEGSSPVEIARRNVVCQVFTDISNFINSPLTSNPNPLTNKVKIAIKAISSFSLPANIAGIGGHMLYGIPNIAPSSSYIWDHEVWKTINSGVNTGYNMAFPMQVGVDMYHGFAAFNFSTLPCPYNYSLNAGPATGEMDFYTLVLHEATHILGFQSYINWNGTSRLVSGTNYFGRYDTYLRSGLNNLPLINQLSSCGPQFITYNSSTPWYNTLSPGQPGCGTLPSTVFQPTTNCGTAVKYAGNTYTVPVYTPPCFNISSLSHFEDFCMIPSNNNGYYVMSDVTGCGPGTAKRYLKPEEASVLCDLGYGLNSTFGSVATLNYYNYGVGCANSVAGVNDGVSNSALYTIVTDVGIGTSAIFPLANDAGASTYTCLSVVVGNGALSNTAGSGSFVYTPTTPGIHILQYIPISSTGKKGNMTYIYIFVRDNCPSNCSISSNGGFENGTGCGLSQPPVVIPFKIDCWTLNYSSADLYARGCSNGAFNLPTVIPPSIDSPSGPGTGNDKFLSCGKGEGAQNQLSSPLVNGGVYQISFKYLERGASLTAEEIMVLGCNQPSGPAGIISSTNIPSFYYPITTFTFNTSNIWKPYALTFTYTGLTSCNYVNVFAGSNPGAVAFTIDDFSIISVGTASSAANFTLPASMCVGQSIPNLTANISPWNTMTQNGQFYGPGVQYVGGIWSLNLNGVPSGIHNYSFVYTNTITNCTYTTYAVMNIQPAINLSVNSSGGNSFCLTPGQTSATLTAHGTPGVFSYVWNPGVVSASMVVVSPTATSVYTVTGNNGFCSTVRTVTVTVVPPTTFTNLPTTLCTGYQWLYLASVLAPGSPTAGTWSSIPPSQYTVNLWIVNNQQAYAQSGSLPGTYTLSYLYTAAPGCSTNTQFTVNVIATPTLTTNGPLSQCTNIPGYTSTLMVTSTSTLPMTYTWTPGSIVSPTAYVSPTIATTYSVIGSDGTCISQQPALAEVVTNSLCCGSNTTATTFQYINSSTIGSATLSGLYAINQNLTITGNVSLNGEYFIAPNVNITIANGANLNTKATYTTPDGPVSYKLHLLSCYNMWNGIIVNNGGKIELEYKDLIEDAKTAITSNGCTNTFTWAPFYDITLTDVVFNRNNISVAIKNYTPTINASPFTVSGCVFTCRNFNYTSSLLYSTAIPVWPDVQDLLSTPGPPGPMDPPHAIGGFSPANLKAPMSVTSSSAGVYVENSGLTFNPTAASPTYNAIVIGDRNYNGNGKNVFDNLNSGIYGVNSNVCSYFNTFQNSTGYSFPGAGIRVENNNTNGLNYNTSLNLTTPTNPTLNINRFYDCYYGIHATQMNELNVQHAEFRSTHSKLNPQPPTNNFFPFGIFIVSNRYKTYTINNNKFLNLSTGIALTAYAGNYNVSGLMGYGQVWGTVNILYNLFSSAATAGAAPGNGYVNYGVVASNNSYYFWGSGLGKGFYTVQPANGFRVQYNNFDQVYRGVYVMNFSNSLFGKFTANNTIRLTPDHVSANKQYGVNYVSNYFGVVNSNTITGFTTNTVTPLSGISYSMNTNSSVQCNNTFTLPVGAGFGGLNSGTIWKANTMQNHSRGMQLSNTGIIGQQGTFNNPSDNFWQGSWTGTSYNTWTDISSFASSSKIYRRNIPGSGYDPLNNSGGFTPNSYVGSGNLVNANNSATYPSCVPVVSGNPPNKTGLASAIASGTLPYINYPVETDEINRILLYRDLDQDTVFRTSCASLQSFYANNQASDIGTLAYIEQLFAEGDLANANSLLASYTPNTAIQNNYKQFLLLYSSYFSSGILDAGENDDLLLLAQKCPFIDGPVVFSARALYDLVNSSVILYNDDSCDEEAAPEGRPGSFISGNALSGAGKKSENSIDYKLFPNPAANELSVFGNRESEEVQVIITDINSRQMLNKILSIASYHAELKLDLLNGIYFVTLVTKDNQRVIKKLVISK